MNFRRGILIAAIACSALLSSAQAQMTCFERTFFTVSEDDNLVREISTTTLATVATYNVDVGGMFPVMGIIGVAAHPDTGDLWLLCVLDGTPPGVPFLVRFEPETLLAEVIGPTILEFICLTFDDSNTLLSISSESSSPPNALCELSQLFGGPTDLCAVGAGDDGESLAFDPTTQSVYHASGSLDVIFEELPDLGVTPCSTTPIDISSTPLVDEPVAAMTWSPEDNALFWKAGGLTGPLYLVNGVGMVVDLGSMDHVVSGMTVRSTPIPCPTDVFRRGDANDDSTVDISDAVFMLAALFVSGADQGVCNDAKDVNDDSTVDISDAVYVLSSLFVSGAPPPPAPNPFCGEDPSADALSCDGYTSC